MPRPPKPSLLEPAHSPSGNGEVVRPSLFAEAMGEVAYYREHNTSFGPYLRTLRESRGLSLRDASEQLGITFAKLQKMETGGRFRIDSLQFFEMIADLYVRPRREVLQAAGIRVLEPHAITNELDEETAFSRLMLHPELRPMRMDEHWLESFSTLQKKQIVEFAKRLDKFLQNVGRLDDILSPDAVEEEE